MTTPIPTKPLRNKQRGAALIIMGLILVLGLITLFTFNMERKTPELAADRKTALALAQAKEALLGWSSVDGSSGTINPGRLPCQDKDNDGDSEGAACPSPYIGRLPWKSLGIAELFDVAAEQLWYVVDADFRTGNGVMNSGIFPTLTFNGQPIVAAVIAPGPVLSTLAQNRSTSGSPAPSNSYLNFLESYTDAPARLTSAALSSAYNDRVLVITPSELFTIITFRMAHELANNWNAPPTYFPPQNTSSIASVQLPTIWSDNDWSSAVTVVSSTVTSFKMSFANCSPGYTITIDNTYHVTRSGQC